MDKKQYSPDWSDVIRPAILKRDSYKCSACGIRHRSVVHKNTDGTYTVCDEFTAEWYRSQGKKTFTIYLTVAHIDHDKSNNDPSNLRTFCPRHHSKFDATHKKQLRKFCLTTKASAPPVNLEAAAKLKTAKIAAVQSCVRSFTGIKITSFEAIQLYDIATK